MNIPFAIVRSKAQLGELVHVKTCAAVAFTKVNGADEAALKAIVEKVAAALDFKEAMKTYGGNTRSARSLAKEAKKHHK